MRFWLAIIICVAFGGKTIGQKTDVLAANRFKSGINRFPKPDSVHNPRKAIIRSLILPGWGQVYNHHWWKVPFMYAGFTALGLAIQYNHKYYDIYLKEAFLRNSPSGRGSPEFAQYGGGAAAFFAAADVNRRNYQLSILGVVGLWGLNCIDAYIDAKFRHSYTVDNDLSFKVTPTLMNQPVYAFTNYGVTPGLKLIFTLK